MKKKHLHANVNRSVGGNIVVFLLLAAVGLFMFVPMWYSIVTAFKPAEELFLFPPRLYVANPTVFNFKNLSLLLSNLWVPFSRYLFNSIFVSLLETFISVFFGSMAAYAFAKHKFPGKKFFWSLIMVTLLFAGGVTALPTYIVKATLGLIDTIWVFVLPSVAVPLYMFLMKQFIEQIPDALLEAARIDGASEFFIYTRVVLPNIKPAWLTVAVLMFQSAWGSGSDGVIFTEELKLLPTALSQLSTGSISLQGVSAASALIMMVPPILAFIFTRSRMMQTMAQSGIKG